jgi:hypothetical protein
MRGEAEVEARREEVRMVRMVRVPSSSILLQHEIHSEKQLAN